MSKIEMYPTSHVESLSMEPDVMLPANGNYYVVANNLDEIQWFLSKIMEHEWWISYGIMKPVFVRDEDEEYDVDEDEHLVDSIDQAWEVRDIRTLSTNEFFDHNEQLHSVKLRNVQLLKKEAIQFTASFLKTVTFPCVVQHSGESSSDRLGSFVMNHCQVIRLGNIPLRDGPIKIFFNWI